MSVRYRIRPAVQADGAFLADMVVEAANWRSGATRPRHEVLDAPEHRRYVSGWMRPGDSGFVAEATTGEGIGAAWYRMLPRSAPGFGYIATGVPELIIGVRPIWRAHGVGRALLRELVERASADGYARLSLSVERDNYAVTLYRSEGFVVTAPGFGRDTMVRRLH
ncbi:GNAT family N-acetyltransferase [Microbacterium sp. cx-55]|uniref:GNAT family N-acetyltransferase n=1 Tax=unclassified Microbacterium TaxID=2609290 RepID=UPI001CBB4C40|nr:MULTISPECIES: GNAT family N-acetyltransferase [unclassified Microbacterium]MBZ4488608.1 GNAT family N-acetyltransferase [Microbacterium sp. cx-55]MCC4909749.1 GNAT family N-acetyltransferase [Microbacterium sp. cx-59]UGB36186.1 GNAT family N-acetyltransferase [Microbacterium sp. cx-55]